MSAKIYQPAKSVMQSGKAKTGRWILEFDRANARKVEPLMGYTSSSDMNAQVKLSFDTLEAAKEYADKHEISYQVKLPKQAKRRAMSYAENFATDRQLPWTH